MTERLLRAERWLSPLGLAGVAGALALLALDPRAALAGWLAAAAFLAALPAGALMLRLTMRLVPGKWAAELEGPAGLLGRLWPLAALGFVPVLAGIRWLYPWHGAPPRSPFAGFWLQPWFFVLRSTGWFVLGWLGAARVGGAGDGLSEGAAAALLIAVVLAANFVFTDWLMTLDPGLASSGFGLQVIAFAHCAALAAMILLRLIAGPPRHPGVLGGLLLTMLLLWAYFQFMPFLIIWSGNLPDNVGWYWTRGSAGWLAALGVAALLGGVPLLGLLAPGVRASGRGLGWCAAAAFVGRAIEFGWLAVPGRGRIAVLAWLVALAGLACLAGAALLRGIDGRVGR